MMMLPEIFVCRTHEFSTYEKHIPAPIFRKSFFLEKCPQKAEIFICGLGFYDLFINGKRITKGYLAPYISNPDDVVFYDRYEVGKYLTEGENVVGIMLGNGLQNAVGCKVWKLDEATFRSSPKLAFSYNDDTGFSFTAEEFKCSDSEILFDDLHCGVFCDKRMEKCGWENAGYDDSEWEKVMLASVPNGEKRITQAEHIVVTKELKPVSIRLAELCEYRQREDLINLFQDIITVETPPERTGGYLFDFGENNAGVVRLKIRGKRGQKISLQFAELITDGKVDYSNINFYPDGYAQRVIYTCRGGEEEVFVPPFAYFGFRYCYVNGIEEEQAKVILRFRQITVRLQQQALCSLSRITIGRALLL